MKFQLQALEEKSEQLNKEITDARDDIIAITAEIEKMRERRDQKRARIEELTSQSQQVPTAHTYPIHVPAYSCAFS